MQRGTANPVSAPQQGAPNPAKDIDWQLCARSSNRVRVILNYSTQVRYFGSIIFVRVSLTWCVDRPWARLRVLGFCAGVVSNLS